MAQIIYDSFVNVAETFCEVSIDCYTSKRGMNMAQDESGASAGTSSRAVGFSNMLCISF